MSAKRRKRQPASGPRAAKVELLRSDSAVGLADRLGELPEIGLSKRCKVCSLATRAPKLWRAAMTHLLAGGSLTALQEWLADRGEEISLDSISRCARNHVKRWVSQVLALRFAGEALAGTLEEKEAGDLAVQFLRELMVFLHALTAQLCLGEELELSEAQGQTGRERLLDEATEPRFRNLVNMGRQVAKDLATAERQRAQTELDRVTLELKGYQVAMQQQELSKKVRAAIVQLAERLSPRLRQEFVAALDAPETERALVGALPAAAGETEAP